MTSAALDVRLRAATLDDCEHVYTWNAADDVRALSGAARSFTLAEHRVWYARRIADPASPMWIIEVEGSGPLGVVRVDALASVGRVSIALAPESRGRGIGRRAITSAMRAWGRAVTAQIHRHNLASRACFEACGFRRAGATGAFDHYLWSP